ncbi:MAG TPA: cyclic nucleotide-binding domain-containing protein [Actinomycetota bacterium]|nr:cyclic nucleotide-binding domain-containing protein [Actinomycetota bacterium]
MLSRLFLIRPGEGRTVALVVGLMFLSVAGMTVGESGASALFFERVGPDALPRVYLLQGVVGLVAMLVLTAVLGRFERRRTYVLLPLLLAALIGIERVLLVVAVPGIYHALWLTTTIGSLVQGVYLWGTAGSVTDTRRAKRLFPLFGGGSILGAVAGGLGTRPLAAAFGAENLLIVWALAFVATSVLTAAVLGVRRREARRRLARRPVTALGELREGFRFVRRSPLLIWMSVASILFSILYYSLYLPFAQVATARYPDPEALAGFFGLFWAVVTSAAFVMSILLANRLLGWFGAAAMILVLPVLYSGAFTTLLLASTFGTLVTIRFGVSAWLQGVSSTSWEALVNVVPEHRRDQTRAFLNGGPAQMGTAIAGVVQIVGQHALSVAQSAAIGLAASLITAVVAWNIRRSYTGALADAIRAGRPRVFDDAIPNSAVALRRDATAIGLAVDALRDPDPRVRRLGGELLEGADDVRANDALRVGLHDEDALVRATAVRALGTSLADDELTRAFGDEDPVVRRTAVAVAREVPASLVFDADPGVVARAAGRLLAEPAGVEAATAIERLIGDADPTTRLLAVNAIGAAPPSGEGTRLARLALEDPSPAVRVAAVEAVASQGGEVAIAAGLDALASPEPAVRAVGRATLRRTGLDGRASALDELVSRWSALARNDTDRAASVTDDGEAADLLRATLGARARSRALIALSAALVRSDDPPATDRALEILADPTAGEVANALETIQAAAPATRPLLALWEPAGARRVGPSTADTVEAIANDEDPFVREVAELVRSSRDRGGSVARTRGSMSQVELVLILRRIPLFSALEPAELQRVAAIAGERTYADGEVIGVEGDVGDEMHVIVDGTVRVVRGDTAIARRGPGDIVGEMAVITKEPRIASLVAEGDVRTLRIEHHAFEGMLRERPDIAIGVMRILADRLSAAAAPVEHPTA